MRAPEITMDTLVGRYIYSTIANNKNIKRVIEIGSGSGNGSTVCIANGLNVHLTKDTKFVCMEPVESHYNDLREGIENSGIDWIEHHNNSSISFDKLSIKNYDDYRSHCLDNKDKFKSLRGLDNKQLISELEGRQVWYEEDCEHFKKCEKGVLESLDGDYDLCLIDGSEFSGYDEFKLIEDRVNMIFLDDIFEYKCQKIVDELHVNDDWVLINIIPERNGFVAFSRTHYK
jgi:hypothetical protein